MPIHWFFIISSLLVLFFPTLELKSHRFVHRSSFIHVLYLSVQYYFRWLGSIYSLSDCWTFLGILVISPPIIDSSFASAHWYKTSSSDYILSLQHHYILLLQSCKAISIYSLSMVCSFPVLYMDCPFKDFHDVR